jgi:Zn-finger nucleic acid-binding protein
MEEMDLKVKASSEESRLCPLDGASMSKEIAHMIVIDRCPECKGVWLDGGELERLTADVESLAVKAMIGGMSGRY